MQNIQFNKKRAQETGELFPESICEDPWIVYHGTSSLYESVIEQDGLCPSKSVVMKEEISSVIDIYERMNWDGNHRGGFPVLKPFSYEHDLADDRGKPIYFAESSHQATLFAGRDFAGGEHIRALRHTIADLKMYLDLPELREEHMRILKNEYKHIQYDKELYRRATAPVDLVWLEKKVSNFNDLYERCQALYDRYTHGIVYAVKFCDDDFHYLEYHKSMGVKAFLPVKTDHIIAKVVIPFDFNSNVWMEDKQSIKAILNSEGILSKLPKSNLIRNKENTE